MTMYFVGIDISKYKHDCCIISAANQKVVSKFTFKNDKSGFEQLNLILNSLSTPEDIKIGFESTAHYALNLELFLENANHSFTSTEYIIVLCLEQYKLITNRSFIKSAQSYSFPGIIRSFHHINRNDTILLR